MRGDIRVKKSAQEILSGDMTNETKAYIMVRRGACGYRRFLWNKVTIRYGICKRDQLAQLFGLCGRSD